MKEHLVLPRTLPSPRRPVSFLLSPRPSPSAPRDGADRVASRASSARATASSCPASRSPSTGRPASAASPPAPTAPSGSDGLAAGDVHGVGRRARPRAARARRCGRRRRAWPGKASRLDLVLAPAPVTERVVVSATRGEATLSSIGVAADVLDRERDRRPGGALAAAAAAGGAGRRHRARRPDGPPGLRLRPRGRVALRARARGRRAGEPARAAPSTSAPPLPFELERVEVVRGAASSLYGTDALAGVVSLQTRRARGGREPVAPGRGRGRLLRLAALARRDVGRPRPPSTGTRACSG